MHKVSKNLPSIYKLTLSYLVAFHLLIYSVPSHSNAASVDSPLEQYTEFEKQVLAKMATAVAEATRGDDDETILTKVAPEFDPTRFITIPVDEGLSIDQCVEAVYRVSAPASGDLTVVPPDTEPMGGAETVRLIASEGSPRAAVKVFDVGESFENFTFPLYECLSTIYIQSLLKLISLPEGRIFDFANLKMVGLCKQGTKNKMFMIFEGAPGQSINYLCQHEETESSLWEEAVNSTALAFAQFHNATKGILTGDAVIETVADSYITAASEVDRRLERFSEGITSPKMDRFSRSLAKIDRFKARMISEDRAIEPLLRDLSLTHGDAHAGNVFYDRGSHRVTFIDFETALKSFQRNADPLKDLGCFLGSIWLKLASSQRVDSETLYRKANSIRENFIRHYLAYKGTDMGHFPKVLERVKYYMWARLFYSGELMECSDETLAYLEEFLDREFEG